MRKIALQLYSLKTTSNMQGLRATIAKAADYGYEGVELAGYFDMTVPEIKEELKKYGLLCAGAHIDYKRILGETETVIAEMKELGAFSLCVPHAKFDTMEEWKDFAARLDEAGKKIRAAGILFGYHNHALEYDKFGDERIIDAILGTAKPENLFFEFDTRHVAKIGIDPVAEAVRYSGRIPVLHARDTDMEHDTAIGAGVVDFKGVVEAAPEIEWFVVENENFDTGEQQLRDSVTFLKQFR